MGTLVQTNSESERCLATYNYVYGYGQTQSGDRVCVQGSGHPTSNSSMYLIKCLLIKLLFSLMEYHKHHNRRKNNVQPFTPKSPKSDKIDIISVRAF